MKEPEIEVGYGLGKGDNAFAVGMEAARQAVTGTEKHPLSTVLVFASACYDLEELLGGIHSVVGDATVLGATTAGEICDGSQQSSVVVAALASPHLNVRVGLGTGVSRD